MLWNQNTQYKSLENNYIERKANPYHYDIRVSYQINFLLVKTHKKKEKIFQLKLNSIPLTHLSEYAANNNENKVTRYTLLVVKL